MASPEYRSRRLVAASDQPSLAPGRYLDRIASRAGSPSPVVVSIHPKGSATCFEPRRASALVTSSSGLQPGNSSAQHLEDG